VIDSDRTILQQEQLSAQLNGTRMMASVNLIRALGGGWHNAESSVKSKS
jgi:multidrug efflux system outer membrane protein